MLHALFQMPPNAINPSKTAPFRSEHGKTLVELAVAPISLGFPGVSEALRKVEVRPAETAKK